MRGFFIILIIGIAFSVNSASVQATEKKLLTFDDLMKVKRVADPQISPDGKWMAYSVTAVNKGKKQPEFRHLDRAAVGGRGATTHPFSRRTSRPRWSPDGKEIAFVSTRDGSSHICLLPLEWGRSGRIHRYRNRSGRSPVLVRMGSTPCSLRRSIPSAITAIRRRRSAAMRPKKSGGRIPGEGSLASRLLFRHWTDWKDGKRSHLFVTPANASQPPRDITPGDYDVPPFSLGGPTTMRFLPMAKKSVTHPITIPTKSARQCGSVSGESGNGRDQEDYVKSGLRRISAIFSATEIYCVSRPVPRGI